VVGYWVLCFVVELFEVIELGDLFVKYVVVGIELWIVLLFVLFWECVVVLIFEFSGIWLCNFDVWCIV